MSHSPLRQGHARAACLVLAVEFTTAAALAGPPIQFGSPVPLDRLGSLPGNPGPGTREILAVGNGAGDIAMCWHATNTVIQARIYSPSGPPRTPVIEVTRQASSGTQLGLDLDSAGNLLVAWVRDYVDATGVGTLVARRFARDGSPAGGEIVVATGVYATYLYTNFLATSTPDGSFVAVWQHGTSLSSGRSLIARAFGPDGQAKGPEAVVSQGEPNLFVGIALSLQGDKALVAYGRTRPSGDRTASELWARWIDSRGAPTSDEMLLVLPSPTFGGYEPIGARAMAAGGFALIFETCDPITFDALCSSTAILEANAAGSILSSRGVNRPTNGFASTESWMATDPLGNLASVALSPSSLQGDVAALNPLTAVATRATLPASSLPEGATAAGIVALGPAQFGLAWYQNDWTYFQAITVGTESTPAPSFYTLEPCRLIDTRAGGPAFTAGEDRAIQASGICSIPAGARALSANLLSVGSTDAGDLRFYRPDQLVPATSALNYGAGQVRANSGVIPLDGSGALALRATQLAGTTHVIIDVSGYFQ